MLQYYLTNQHINQKPAGVLLAREYVTSMVNSYSWLVEPLLRIRKTLENLSLNDKGEINGLTRKYTKNGQPYLSISDEYYYAPANKHIRYEVLKKLNSFDHTYEIRFIAGDDHHKMHCRVIMTVERHMPFFLWTHGFSKSKFNTFYFRLRNANELTDRLSEIAFNIYKDMDENYSAENYIGKEGARYEV